MGTYRRTRDHRGRPVACCTYCGATSGWQRSEKAADQWQRRHVCNPPEKDQPKEKL